MKSKVLKKIAIMSKYAVYGMILQTVLCTLLFANKGEAQRKSLDQIPVTIGLNDAKIEEAFSRIEGITEFDFAYKRGDLDSKKRISLNVNEQPLSELLLTIARETGLQFRRIDETINVSKAKGEDLLVSEELQAINEADIEISGKVTDSENFPLPGVNVLVKGTTNGTITSADGMFRITADENATLTFSFVGYKSIEVPVSGRTNLTVTLQDDIASLEEIVVIGYGSVNKSDLTGAVSSLKSDDLNPGVNVSVDQMMLGRAAGVQITQSSSEPGGGLSIRIRGSSSINAGNEPLYVIDGFPIDNSPNLSSGGDAQLATNQSPRNPLNALNPNDIESIEILKDASATAIYGSRGANGVILVTTKKGKNDRLTASYNAYGGSQNVAKKMDLLTTSQYIDLMNDLSVVQGNAEVFSAVDRSTIGAGVDWQDEIYRPASVTDHNLSLTGGNQSTSVFASVNYFDQKGVVKNSGIKKYIGRINLDTKIGDKFNVGLNLNTSLVTDNNSIDGLNTNENAGPIYASLLYDPTESIYAPDGSFSQSPFLTVNNPVSLIEGIKSENETNRTFGNINASYQILEGLSAKINFGSDRQVSRRDIYNSRLTLRGGPAGGIANISVLERTNYLVEYTMNYSRDINENNSFSVLGGTTYQQFDTRAFAATINSFPTDALGTGNLGLGDTNNDDLSSNREQNTLVSYLGRVNYNLMKKFLFTGSIRADGSSRFGANDKFGYFPSFAVGWKLTEEDFIPVAFEELKLRASWGQTGNQEIGNYASQLTFGAGPNVAFNNAPQVSVIPSRIANPDLRWETTEQINVGVDVSILAGRVSGTLDYFSKDTRDLLFNLPLPLASGYSSILTNVGRVQNRGVELLINSSNISTTNFQWKSSFNISAIRNKVIDLGRVDQIETGNIQAVGNTAIIKEGSPLASYYGYNMIGIFQQGDDIANSPQPSAQPGFPMFADLNGDGAITPLDQTIIGSPFPDFTFGFQNSISYKNWQLDLFFQGLQGIDLLNINVIESLYPANFRRNRLADQSLDRWTPENTDAKWPSGVNPNAYGAGKVSTMVLQDGSYIRLKNVQLSYTVPTVNMDFLSSLRLYCTAQNVFTITDYVGFDPEANSFGSSNVRVDYSSYPLARTFIVGLNAKF
ncbi:MAG: TonB-dependent receptor [Imperialibacter sp.]|uniref:TonB-dependent receptor n=1 Tax=Imperialibacter sp. TaxID=2038411 RepID=UPI0032EFC8BB